MNYFELQRHAMPGAEYVLLKCWTRKDEPHKLILKISKNYNIRMDDSLIGEKWMQKFFSASFLTTGVFPGNYPDIPRQTRENMREFILRKTWDAAFLNESEFIPIFKQISDRGWVSKQLIREVRNFGQKFLVNFFLLRNFHLQGT